MKLRRLYSSLREKLGATLDSTVFSDPLMHPHMGVQFINQDGSSAGPIIAKPEDFQFAEPMAGPFYDLPAIGLSPVIPSGRFGRKKGLRVVIVQPDGNHGYAGPFATTAPLAKVKGLAAELGIKWYHMGFGSSEIIYTEMPSFDDCVEYEREATKDGGV